MQTRYSIKDLEQLSGIKAHTLRIWESRYELIKPQRTETNIRYYKDDDLKKILNVALLVNDGMRISKVACLSDREIQDMVLDHARYRGSFESQVNSLKVAMLSFNQELFDKVLNQSMLKIGTEETFSKVVAQFIHQVGILWQTNTISVAHEHFVSNLIKQKLYAAIDQLVVTRGHNGYRYLLYLPGEELHELGLLYIHYLLKKRGHEVIYLGQSVPAQYLKEIHSQVPCQRFVSIITTRPCSSGMGEYLEQLHQLFAGEDVRFYLSGHQFSDFEPNGLPSMFRVIPSFEDLKARVIEE